MDGIFDKGYTKVLKSWAEDYKTNGKGAIQNWLSNKMESTLGKNGVELASEIQEAVMEYSQHQRENFRSRSGNRPL